MKDPIYVSRSSIVQVDPNLPENAIRPDPENIRPTNAYGLQFETISNPDELPYVTIDLNKPYFPQTSLRVLGVIFSHSNQLSVNVLYQSDDRNETRIPLLTSDGTPMLNLPIIEDKEYQIPMTDIGKLQVFIVSSADVGADLYHLTVDILGCAESKSKNLHIIYYWNK
jgi:hypothetical protein